MLFLLLTLKVSILNENNPRSSALFNCPLREVAGKKINQCIGKPKLGVRITAFAGDTWIAYQRIICPENQGKSIEEK